VQLGRLIPHHKAADEEVQLHLNVAQVAHAFDEPFDIPLVPADDGGRWMAAG
jgi:hypothetical protein